MNRIKTLSAVILTTVLMAALTGCPHRHHDDHYPPPPDHSHDHDHDNH